MTDEPVFEASIGTRLGEMTSELGQQAVCALAYAERGDQRAGREAGTQQVSDVNG